MLTKLPIIKYHSMSEVTYHVKSYYFTSCDSTLDNRISRRVDLNHIAQFPIIDSRSVGKS